MKFPQFLLPNNGYSIQKLILAVAVAYTRVKFGLLSQGKSIGSSCFRTKS